MLSKEWDTAIAGFMANERAGGKTPATVAQRRHHLAHLARRVTCGPWAASTGILLEYTAGQDWARETRRQRRTTLVRFYQYGVDNGLIGENVADHLPHVRMVAGRARPAPDLAYREALIAAHPREALMLRLAAEVGMRRAEVAQVHSDDLMHDLVGFSLIVHGKGERTRIVPLPHSLGVQLEGMPHGFIFPGKDDGHLSPAYVGKRVSRLLPDGWTMHTLRHRFATRMYALERDLLMVQEALGHASLATTRGYVQYDRTRMRAAMEELAS